MKRGLLCLVLCLLLTACGGSVEPPQQSMPLLGSAAEMEEDAILLRVNGRDVPAWRCLYWLARACDAICAEYQAAGMEPDWTAVVGGQSLADYAKAQALSDTVLYAVVENWAEQYGCAGGEVTGILTEPAPELGLDEARAAELDRVGRMYGQLYTLFCTEGSVLSPPEETMEAFAEENGWVGFDRILVSFGEDREAAEDRAEDLFSRLNAAGDAAAEFAALAAEGDDPAGSRTLRLSAGELENGLRDALEHLAVGQYSGILETEEGFSILLRQKPDRQVLLEPCFDRLLQRAAEGAEVQSTAAYTELDVPSFYRALRQLRKELFTPENGGKTAGI